MTTKSTNAQIAFDVLSDARYTDQQSIRAIVHNATDAGYEFGSKTPDKSLPRDLAKHPETFEKVRGNGKSVYYQLVEGAVRPEGTVKKTATKNAAKHEDADVNEAADALEADPETASKSAEKNPPKDLEKEMENIESEKTESPQFETRYWQSVSECVDSIITMIEMVPGMIMNKKVKHPVMRSSNSGNVVRIDLKDGDNDMPIGTVDCPEGDDNNLETDVKAVIRRFNQTVDTAVKKYNADSIDRPEDACVGIETVDAKTGKKAVIKKAPKKTKSKAQQQVDADREANAKQQEHVCIRTHADFAEIRNKEMLEMLDAVLDPEADLEKFELLKVDGNWDLLATYVDGVVFNLGVIHPEMDADVLTDIKKQLEFANKAIEQIRFHSSEVRDENGESLKVPDECCDWDASEWQTAITVVQEHREEMAERETKLKELESRREALVAKQTDYETQHSALENKIEQTAEAVEDIDSKIAALQPAE